MHGACDRNDVTVHSTGVLVGHGEGATAEGAASGTWTSGAGDDDSLASGSIVTRDDQGEGIVHRVARGLRATTSRVPSSSPLPSRIVITACQPGPLLRFSMRASTETSASAADTKT